MGAVSLGCSSCGPPESSAPGPGAATQALSGSPDKPEATAPGITHIPYEAAKDARKALAKAIKSGDPEGPDYTEFRRCVARGEPFFRDRGFMSEALLGGAVTDEKAGALGRLDAAIALRDAKAIAEAGGEVDRALELVMSSLLRSRIKAEDLPRILPRAAYWLGAALSGSLPWLSRSKAGALADAEGAVQAIDLALVEWRAVVTEIEPNVSAAAARARVLVNVLKEALRAAASKGELSGRASLVVSTGWLGADLRLVTSVFGAPWKPYEPRVSAGATEPISVLSVPNLSRGLPADPAEVTRLAALGERLFSDPRLSAGGARSCATCHLPEKAYSDDKPTSGSLVPGVPIVRNTPGLLYSSLHASQFWDGRALTSERQAMIVMHSKTEMGGVTATFSAVGAKDEREAAAALSAFEATRLVPAMSPLDRFARGEGGALSREERDGFDVFAGKGHCARCHAPPLFGGSQPTDFSTAVYSVIGVPKVSLEKLSPGGSPKGPVPAPKNAKDPDKGRAAVTKQDRDQGAFKTPTVRNVGLTAPYFHNGAFPTLEEVIELYDKGGGPGFGLRVPNLDPDIVPLELTAAEKRALLQFLRVALADPPSSFATGEGAGEAPPPD